MSNTYVNLALSCDGKRLHIASRIFSTLIKRTIRLLGASLSLLSEHLAVDLGRAELF